MPSLTLNNNFELPHGVATAAYMVVDVTGGAWRFSSDDMDAVHRLRFWTTQSPFGQQELGPM